MAADSRPPAGRRLHRNGRPPLLGRGGELGGHLYGFDKATFKSIDANTREVRWAKRGLGKGSLIRVGDLLVVLSERGRLLLVEASPEEYRELAAHDVLSGRSWTQPSLADGRLYLRNLAEIVALEVSDDA